MTAEEEQDKAQERVFKKHQARVEAYKEIFEYNGTGKTVLYDLMVHHGFIRSTYDDNPSKQAFKEGERNVVLRILSLIETNMADLELKIKGASKYGRDYE